MTCSEVRSHSLLTSPPVWSLAPVPAGSLNTEVFPVSSPQITLCTPRQDPHLVCSEFPLPSPLRTLCCLSSSSSSAWPHRRRLRPRSRTWCHRCLPSTPSSWEQEESSETSSSEQLYNERFMYWASIQTVSNSTNLSWRGRWTTLPVWDDIMWRPFELRSTDVNFFITAVIGAQQRYLFEMKDLNIY